MLGATRLFSCSGHAAAGIADLSFHFSAGSGPLRRAETHLWRQTGLAGAVAPAVESVSDPQTASRPFSVVCMRSDSPQSLRCLAPRFGRLHEWTAGFCGPVHSDSIATSGRRRCRGQMRCWRCTAACGSKAVKAVIAGCCSLDRSRWVLFSQFAPHRSVIAGSFSAAHFAVHPRIDEAWHDRPAEKQVIKP